MTSVHAHTAHAARRDRGRLHYVDNLRILAIILVFVAHVCEVFNPWDEWHITNGARSRLAGEVTALVAPWLMPLVMLLSGVGAWYSLRTRSNGAYLRERTARLLLPLTIGTIVLVSPQVYLERVWQGRFAGSYWEFLPRFFHGIYPRGNFSWHHLWFLAHLLAYSFITLPLFRALQRPRGRRLMQHAARLCTRPGGMLVLAFPLILERNVLWGLFPERHMLGSDWSNHALLFVAYIYGFVLAGSPWLGRAIDLQWRGALITGALGTVALMVGLWTDIVPDRIPPQYHAVYLAFWMLYAICAWAWMVAMLGVGRAWLARETALTRYGRDAALGMYLIHQPIIVAIAFLTVPLAIGVGAKFALVFGLSAAATLIVLEMFRHDGILRRSLRLPRRRAPRMRWARP